MRSRPAARTLRAARRPAAALVVAPVVLRVVALVLALAATVAPAILPAQQGRPQGAGTADLIVTHARIYTVDEARPLATALAVKDGRVLFVGDDRGASALKGAATRMVDARGQTIIPGMVDAHAHLLGLGLTLRNVDLTGTRSYDEVVARVAARAREVPKGSWILWRGWDQNDWGDTRFPTHERLSAAVPDHPVLLTRVDGHAVLANAAAMRVAGLTSATQDPSGGRVERDAQGNPTGVLVDNAESIVAGKVPPATRADLREALLAATKVAHRWGLTGVHEAGVNRAAIDTYEALAREGALDFRAYVMIADDSADIAHYLARGPQSGLHGGRVWVRSIKLYSDGALGSRGAAMLEPYSDAPDQRGLLVSAPAHIEDVARRALRAGFQVNTHAIGDRGNRLVLDAYEAALGAVPAADHRFRVEHAQILHSDDIPRFARLGVIPSMQASHQTSDMYWAGSRVGPTRLLGAYAWRSLLASGAIIPNGSDFPVEQVNPLISFHAAVARQDAADWPIGGWYPEQRMTREEGLRSMTLWPAMAAFQERELGTLTPGKFADFVMLDRDVMRVPAELILGTQVVATYVGGKLVYERR